MQCYERVHLTYTVEGEGCVHRGVVPVFDATSHVEMALLLLHALGAAGVLTQGRALRQWRPAVAHMCAESAPRGDARSTPIADIRRELERRGIDAAAPALTPLHSTAADFGRARGRGERVALDSA